MINRDAVVAAMVGKFARQTLVFSRWLMGYIDRHHGIDHDPEGRAEILRLLADLERLLKEYDL